MAKLTISLPDAEEVTHDLGEEKVTVGRESDNTIPITDGSMSGHHAEIVMESNQHKVRDLGSTNGTKVNGKTLTDEPHTLEHGDNILFGQVAALYLEEEGGEVKPLPEQQEAEAEVASTSSKPSSFANAAPFQQKKKKKDPFGVAVVLIAVVGFLLLALAIYSAANLTTPTSI